MRGRQRRGMCDFRTMVAYFMKHLSDISTLTQDDIMALVQRAQELQQTPRELLPIIPQTVATLFYENSTRTRISFELAAKQLGMTTVDFNPESSSSKKGESVLDTVQTLSAMGVNLFIIRHNENGILQALIRSLGHQAQFINAGDGTNEHPSQALLDLMTILQYKPDLSGLKISIIGNLRHSRVANSMQKICAAMGIEQLTLVAPECWRPSTLHHGQFTTSLQEGLQDADVVMTLRIQQERLQPEEQFDIAQYRQLYALTAEKLKIAKKDAIIMHPGPINRGVEIDNDVADSPDSVILQQVRNGVAMRMAILEATARGGERFAPSSQ
jgi:aspartate carbamoyltransferase catalytic subunit